MDQNTDTASDSISALLGKLLEALADGSGIKKIIEIGYELLGNPISLVDTSRKTIVLTNSPEVADDLTWQELAKDGYFSSYTVKHNFAVGLTNKLSESSKPFFWRGDEYIKYNRLLSRILYKNKTIGILAVMESKRPFMDSDLELAAMLCDAISAEMQKNIFVHSTMGYGHEEFLKDLLEGKIKDSKVAASRAEYLKLEFKKNIFVLVIDIKNLDKTTMFPLYLRKQLEQIFVNSFTIEYNDNVVLILSSASRKHFYDKGLRELTEYLEQYSLSCGLSSPSTSLVDLKEYYQQAFAALKLGRHFNIKDTVFHYKDFVVYHFLEICSASIGPEKFMHPAISILSDYDLQNCTTYLNTLYNYFECGMNIPRAAFKMSIHRNSMFYRMKKVSDIINSDLTDANELLHLALSFKVLEYMKSEQLKVD